MLIRLLPEQVSARWDTLAPLLAKGLNPEIGYSRQGMVNILRAVLMEDLVVWIYSEDDKFIFAVMTQVRSNSITLDRSLLVWSLASIRTVTPSMLRDGFEKLSEYARGQGCRAITGYVAEPALLEMYRRIFDAKTRFTYVEVDL